MDSFLGAPDPVHTHPLGDKIMFDFNIQNDAVETTATVASNKALAHALIERLARDDVFRAEMVADPVATVAQYGFSIDRSCLPEGGIKLPSKAVLNEHLDAIAERFAAASYLIVVFQL
jgi:putative modified peptide